MTQSDAENSAYTNQINFLSVSNGGQSFIFKFTDELFIEIDLRILINNSVGEITEFYKIKLESVRNL